MRREQEGRRLLLNKEGGKGIGKRILAFVLSLAFVLTLVGGGAEGQANAATTTIDAAKLKSISRLSFPMRDDNKQLYTLYLFANDETKYVTTQDEAWAGASVGDVIYSGKYQAALVKSGQKRGRVQAINLNYRAINVTRNESFRLSGDGKTRPDLLFLSEPASSNVNAIYGFVITGGVLHSLDFASETGVKWGKDGYAGLGSTAVRGLSGNRIQTRVYDNSTGQYLFNMYKLNVKGLKLQRIDNVYRPSRNWPTTQGAHAFLDSIKSAAFKRVLPRKPQVKIGMTEKQVLGVMGQPLVKENGEWAGYFGYGSLWIGFDSYLWDGKLESSSSRVVELTTQLGNYVLRPDQVREWLGKPTEEYENAHEVGYIMLYRWKNALITFEYEDDFSPIHSFTIY